MGIGLVHGLTNMGGGLLSLYASVRHNAKFEIRRKIALGYLAFAFAQLLVLGYATKVTGTLLICAALMAFAAGVTYIVVGRAIFRQISAGRYSVHFSAFEISCGTVLIARRALTLTPLL
jgi:hypothetical protein